MHEYLPGPFICEKCGRQMALQDVRIESTYGGDGPGYVNFCHNGCSEGFHGSLKIRSDIMDAVLLSFPDEVYQSLSDDYEKYDDPHFLSIRRELFGE